MRSEPEIASRLGFEVVVGAPRDPRSRFNPTRGWWHFRRDVCGLLDDAVVAGVWHAPTAEVGCVGIDASRGSLAIDGLEILENAIGAHGPFSFWLAYPAERRLPGYLSVNVAETSTVWAKDRVGSIASCGALYTLDYAYSNAGSIPSDACLAAGMRRPGPVDEPNGWTEPLRLNIGQGAPAPVLSGVGQNNFWPHILSGENVLDIWPSFASDPENPQMAGVRENFYTKAGIAIANVPVNRRSAVQQLVFGTSKIATPLWFLILDCLGGEFRLLDFLSGNARWHWIAPALGFWDGWLAELACVRGGICFTAEVQNVTSVPPSPYRDIRWKEAGRAEGTPPDWRNLIALRGSRSEIFADGSWQSLLASILQDLNAGSAAMGDSDLPDDDPELLARAISAACLLPKSPVRVKLPPVPVSDAPVWLSEQWDERIANQPWLDLVGSAIWPETRWPRALLRGLSEEKTEVESWPVLGSSWHRRFYDAVHDQAVSFRVAGWEFERESTLGKQGALLGSTLILGLNRRTQNVAQFELW